MVCLATIVALFLLFKLFVFRVINEVKKAGQIWILEDGLIETVVNVLNKCGIFLGNPRKLQKLTE